MDLFSILKESVIDSGIDCLKMLPFLFAAFVLIEGFENYSGKGMVRMLKKVGKVGPLAGAAAGCIPQCGASVMAANLYAGGIISAGTLLSVFIATSDEAILIIIGNPGHLREVGVLLLAKVIIGTSAGILVDILFGSRIRPSKTPGKCGVGCECHEEHAGILFPAWRHTVKIFLYLFVFTAVLNLCIGAVGVENLSRLLLGDTVFQPVIAALIGLIPNCAASVLLTQLYLNGAISFASVISGLCSGAGIGLIVLFKMNKNRGDNIWITGILVSIAIIAGILMELLF